MGTAVGSQDVRESQMCTALSNARSAQWQNFLFSLAREGPINIDIFWTSVASTKLMALDSTVTSDIRPFLRILLLTGAFSVFLRLILYSSRWEGERNGSWGDWLGGVDWIVLAQDMDRWRAVVNAVMNRLVMGPQR
jgi:hypothetical protein